MLIGLLLILSQEISDTWSCKEINDLSTFSHRKCFVVAENHLFSMVNNPKTGECGGFVCWESQLTLLNKAKLTWIYNYFRGQISISETINSMMKLVWHWTLENEALKIVSRCPRSTLKPYLYKRRIEGLDDFLTCEHSVAVHTLPSTSQDDFVKNFLQFLRNNSMHDFDKHHKFRRTSALYFGCALSVRNVNSTNVETHFTCVYCSKEESLTHKFNECVDYTSKSENSTDFHNLCIATKYVDLYGCEPKNICKPPIPDFWKLVFPGELEQIYGIDSGEEIWLAIDHTSIRMTNADEIQRDNELILHTKASQNLWFFNYLPLPDSSFIYDEETAGKLKILFEKSYVRPKRQTQKLTNDRQENKRPYQNYYPTCCTYLLILNFLLLLGISVLIYFTYQHHKKTHL